MVVVKYSVLVAALLVLQIQCQELEELPTFVTGRPETQRRGRTTPLTANIGEASCLTAGNVGGVKKFCGKIDVCDGATATVVTCNAAGDAVDTAVIAITCNSTAPFCDDTTAPGAAVCSATMPSTCPPCKLVANKDKFFCGNADKCASSTSVITCNAAGNDISATSPCASPTPFCIETSAGKAACSATKPPICLATPCTLSANAGLFFCGDVDKCATSTSVVECDATGMKVAETYPCDASSFCEEGGCSDTKPESCPAAPSSFKCTGKGIYPDPLNCKKYYYCKGSGLPAQTFTCPNLYVFDPSAKNGEVCRLTNNNQCITVKCTSANTNVPMVYPNFPKALGAYVVRCNTAPVPHQVFKCDASFEVVPNTYPVKCTLVCKRAENIAHPTSDTKYYKCLRSGSKFEPFLTDCYDGMHFDAAKKICV